jgi:hypothetical protein
MMVVNRLLLKWIERMSTTDERQILNDELRGGRSQQPTAMTASPVAGTL